MGHVVRLETTSLDAESTPRRPYNGALTGRPSEKKDASTNFLPTLFEIMTEIFMGERRMREFFDTFSTKRPRIDAAAAGGAHRRRLPERDNATRKFRRFFQTDKSHRMATFF
ncbi:hypothetical protein Zmor_000032 [Zophobas morio]|uniref:Uncharacterized protein n=1 Tax=Zophobas morio TaxID=2755281 RepID=A0AA38J4P0_9CUCU|nr:hypothetical protein Zmor_000032 [Zophobas morio]